MNFSTLMTRERLDVSVGANPGNGSVIGSTNDKIALFATMGHIIGECTYRLTELVRLVCGYGSFYMIILRIVGQCQDFVF